MICSTCKKDMIVVEHNKVELDYCPNCRGVWFDAGELELLLSSMGLDSRSIFLTDILTLPEIQSIEKKRKCPICRQKMKKTTIGQEDAILIDICKRGDGLWFDSGEVANLIKQISDKEPSKQNSQQQVISFLGEVFEAEK